MNRRKGGQRAEDVEEDSMKVALSRQDEFCHLKLIVGVNRIATGLM